jgi:hypothetical protein
MPWLKRNLYFLIGSALALALIGLAGWYLYSKWQLNGETLENLNKDYATLDDLNKQDPHPGTGRPNDIDNINTAQNQKKELLTFKEKARTHFQRIAPIPDVPNVTDQSFATNLSRTISQLQRDATNASIALPAEYCFSFQAQARKLSFAPGSLDALALALGEVKTIVDVLIQAKVNALDSIRRERVSPDDLSSSGTGDYLPDKSVTNAQAIITPYELTFRCFGQELGNVLAGLACSPCALIVKAINVEGLAAGGLIPEPGFADTLAPLPLAPTYLAQPGPNPALEAARRQAENQSAAEAMRRRYGLDRYGRRGGTLGRPQPPPPQPSYSPYSPQPLPNPATPPLKTGPTVVLDEKQLKVVMMLSVVKLETKPAAGR